MPKRPSALIDRRTVLAVPPTARFNLPDNWHDVTREIKRPGWLSRPVIEVDTVEEQRKNRDKPRQDAKPFGVFATAHEGQRPMLVLGLGEEYAEDLKEMAERVAEKNRKYAADFAQRQREKAEAWRANLWDFLEITKDHHKRNHRTSPAPNNTTPTNGKRYY